MMLFENAHEVLAAYAADVISREEARAALGYDDNDTDE